MEAQFTISSIIFIVLVIVPGIFFKRFYFQGEFSKQFNAGLFADRLITSVFWGFVIQVVTFIVFSNTLNFTYQSIQQPVSKAYTDLSSNSIPDIDSLNTRYILAYLLASIFIAITMGSVLHRLVRFFKIDVKFNVFRFANQWNYFLRGDILHTHEFKGFKNGKVLTTLVDVVFENGEGKTKMVSGFLTQYLVSSRTGELETIILTDAKRFSNTDNAFKGVEGDCLIIPYSRVIDMNLSYIIKKPDSGRSKLLLKNSLSGLAVFVALFIIIYPWFLQLSAVRILTGILIAFGAWLFTIAVIMTPFQPVETRLKGSAYWISVFLAVSMIFISLEVLRLFSLFSSLS